MPAAVNTYNFTYSSEPKSMVFDGMKTLQAVRCLAFDPKGSYHV